ncbi:hypothetical protein BAUCODRAFT_417232 [Baudoinia panamericana UAMH 10762]|uniref:Uncharacterized protein n=1 Tax=Baudoinia panamericana (strain UAMH 10762) TaxID=717646 RepID=M2NG15_BAUPA|nr:uncharacterized protein BAUCODRAFT_417232 [Baudoinia panamericana UAMH 10762]EMC98229.1 hypothetical protein BAUCODRAFT_417232 [Baudoinia panamericana UAMH 10762]
MAFGVDGGTDETARPSVCGAAVAHYATLQEEFPTGFFDLPAELRNAIFEIAASDIELILVEKHQCHPQAGRTLAVPGLLMASKQTRQEARPVLLRLAKVSALVRDFDFQSLRRDIALLPRSDRRAMMANCGPTLRLHITHCDQTALRALYLWIRRQARCRALGRQKMQETPRLTWSYEVEPAVVRDRFENSRLGMMVGGSSVVSSTLNMLVQLRDVLKEHEQSELDLIVLAFERRKARARTT